MGHEFVKVARTSDIPPDGVKTYTVGDHKIALCNEGGSFYAVADLCTHDNGPLGQGELIDGQIECPRHGATFDIKSGTATRLPAVIPIATYPVEVRGEEIWVGVEPCST